MEGGGLTPTSQCFFVAAPSVHRHQANTRYRAVRTRKGYSQISARTARAVRGSRDHRRRPCKLGLLIRQSEPTGLLFFAFSEAIAAWRVRAAGYSLGRVEHPLHSDQEPLRPLASDRAPVD
jgi:hypothetical protein